MRADVTPLSVTHTQAAMRPSRDSLQTHGYAVANVMLVYIGSNVSKRDPVERLLALKRQ